MNPVEAALAELHSALTAFLDLLERETAALKAGRTDDLGSAVADKPAASEAVNTAWNRLVVASGVDPARGESLDTRFYAHPALLAAWREVRRLAEQAERVNRGNGILIEAQLQRTRQALDVLQTAANRGALYGADGRIVDGLRSGHTLDKA